MGGGSFERAWRHPTHPDRRPRLNRGVAVLSRPHRGQHLDRLVHPPPSLIAAQPECIELHVAMSEADPEVEPPARAPIEHRRGAGERERVVLGGEQHRGSHPEPARQPGHEREGVERRRGPSVVPDAVLGGPDRVEPELLGEHGVLAQRAIVRDPIAGMKSH